MLQRGPSESPRSPRRCSPSPGVDSYGLPTSRQPNAEEVRLAVQNDPTNALAIIQAASARECPYAWHMRSYPTQYVPIEVERTVKVTEYVDRPVPHPIPDPAVEEELRRVQSELNRLREPPPTQAKGEVTKSKDKLSLKSQNEKLRGLLVKKDAQISDLQLALRKNFALAKELADQSCPELVEVRKEGERMLQLKVIKLQEELRHKESYIQEVTQALIDCSSYVLRVQREVQEILRTERGELSAAWEDMHRLEVRTRTLEKELTVVPQLKNQIREQEAYLEELKQQLEDKDDIIDALEEQFRQSVHDEASELTREEVLVRLTQLRFKLALKNAQELRSKAEILRLREKLVSCENELKRHAEAAETSKAESDKLRSTVEGLHGQLALLRRDLLAATAPIKPIIMPAPIYDDTTRLLDAPSAPRVKPMTEQDIVAAFSLFDASIQGELPAWDTMLYLRCLGFHTDDPAVRKLVSKYRHADGTITLEEFRDMIQALQQEYAPLQTSALRVLSHWQDASKRRIDATKKKTQKKKDSEEEEREEAEKAYLKVTSMSVRNTPLSAADVDAAFELFDFEVVGELDHHEVGTAIRVLGLVRTEADLQALRVMMQAEFSHTLNREEWCDLVGYCQGAKPNFVRRTVLESKLPKERIYPKPFPTAGRAYPLTERDVDAAFRLFDVDRSGLLPGHLVPTYLEVLGLVCSGEEFTTLLVTQYKVDLTQKVPLQYFHRIVRFVQHHLEFLNPHPKPSTVRRGGDAEDVRRLPPYMAPTPVSASKGVFSPPSAKVLPTHPNTAAFSPRTRKPGQFPPWMVPAQVPTILESVDMKEALRGSPGVLPPPTDEALRLARGEAKEKEADEDSSTTLTAPEPPPAPEGPKQLDQADILMVFSFYAKHFNCPQVSLAAGSKALSLPHVALAVRSIGFDVTKRFLEQIWPFDRKKDAAQRKGGGAGDELILDENEFVRLIRNIERYGTKRMTEHVRIPKAVNRHLSGGALRENDIQWVFDLIDDERKEFLTAREFRTMLTLLGFTLQEEPEIQNVIVTYDRNRLSRSSREHRIFEMHDCVEVVRMLTQKPLSAREFHPLSSFL